VPYKALLRIRRKILTAKLPTGFTVFLASLSCFLLKGVVTKEVGKKTTIAFKIY
jgi:hypothetical protein